MSCNPTRIELSNDATTTVSFTVTPAPTGTVAIYFDVPGLSIDTQTNLSSGSASIDIPAVSGDTNSIYDATIQVGTGAAIPADVQVVDSSAAQAVGVTVSGSSVTYCAPTGGGDNPGGGIQERTYSKNLDIVAQDMISGETSVMILGDSINNPQSLTFMKYGYMNKWKPNYWRGLNVALSDGAAGTNGFQIAGAVAVNVSGNAQSTGPDPENSFFGSSDHSGKSVQANAAFTALMEKTSTGSTSIAATIRPVWNPSGSEDFPTPGTGYLHEWKGEMQSQPLWYGERIRYRVQFYTDTSESVRVWWRWGTDGSGNPATQIVDYTPSQGFNTIVSPVVDNSGATGTAVGTCDIYMQGSAGSQNMSIIGIVAEDIDAPGLSLSYMGGGGWKTANHALDDDTAPGTGSGNTGDRAAYYENTAAQKYLEFMDTDVVMIHIGANDPDVSGVSDYLPSVLTRFRSLRTGLKFLLVAQYNTNGDSNQESRWDAQSDYMRGLAGSSGNEDVAFLDLNMMIVDDPDLGNYSDWQGTYLADGVHPNATGSDKFAELEWDEIVAAAGAAGSEASWPSKGSSELTTVGTITTGRWSASPVALDHGGTGSVTAADARKALGVTNTGSYTGQIETAADKTYTLDPGVVAARTITGFYIKSDSGTCTANLKVGTDVVRTASVSTSSGDQTPLAYTEVAVDDVITLVISSNSSATDVTFSVEYSS